MPSAAKKPKTSEVKSKPPGEANYLRRLAKMCWRDRNRWQRAGLVIFGLAVLFYIQVIAVSQWYINKHKNEPLNIGVTFIADYARYFDLDPHQTMLALRDDLGFKRFRLTTYWSNIEPQQGKYDFSELDWELDRVDEVGGQTTLAIGLRQPRWPECHFPDWAANEPRSTWEPQLDAYMTAVINHVKSRKSLVSYQLENEYFLGVFGKCPSHPRARLQSEFDMVKRLDPNHPVIISLANNYFGLPLGQPRPDQFGISVYKRVWDKTVTKHYFEYPFTPRYYTWRSGLTEIFTGRSSMLHELQAEPWPPHDMSLKDTSIAEQSKSMDAARLKTRIQYGEKTGYRDIDLWGGEWWYWRKVKLNDPSLWETMRTEINSR